MVFFLAKYLVEFRDVRFLKTWQGLSKISWKSVWLGWILWFWIFDFFLMEKSPFNFHDFLRIFHLQSLHFLIFGGISRKSWNPISYHFHGFGDFQAQKSSYNL